MECLINDKIDLNGGIKVVFPAGFSNFATSCEMTSTYTGSYTCVNDGDSYKISITDEMSTGTTVSISALVTTPSTAGLTAVFELTTFTTESP